MRLIKENKKKSLNNIPWTLNSICAGSIAGGGDTPSRGVTNLNLKLCSENEATCKNKSALFFDKINPRHFGQFELRA